MLNFLIKSPKCDEEKRLEQLRSIIGQKKRREVLEEFNLWKTDNLRNHKILVLFEYDDALDIDNESWETIFVIFKKNYHFWADNMERAS